MSKSMRSSVTTICLYVAWREPSNLVLLILSHCNTLTVWNLLTGEAQIEANVWNRVLVYRKQTLCKWFEYFTWRIIQYRVFKWFALPWLRLTLTDLALGLFLERFQTIFNRIKTAICRDWNQSTNAI